MAFRSKSQERAIAEVRWLVDRYARHHDVTLLRSVDQILDLSYFERFIPALAELDHPLPIYYETKTNLKRGQVEALARANVKLLQPGIESLSTPVLRLMRKGCTMLQNVQLMKWCASAGIVPLWNLLYGFPGEDPGEYARMAALIDAISHLQPPSNLYRVRLVRFSPYFRSPEAHGLRNVRPSETYRHLYPGIAEDILRDRAFRFDFDFADQRDLAYIEPTVRAVERWTSAADRGALVGFSWDDGLCVWDTRPGARRPWTRLSPLQKEIVAHCDGIRSERAVGELVERREGRSLAAGELAAILGPLEEQRLLLREDHRLLSLVILREELAMPVIPPQLVYQLPDRRVA